MIASASPFLAWPKCPAFCWSGRASWGSTFIHGAHIRVTLLIGRLPLRIRVYVEAFCLAVSLALCLYLAWYLYWLLADSIAFGETSYGLVSIPLWIPQSAMLMGVLLFCLALGEAFAQTLLTALRHPASFTIDDPPPQ